MFGIEEQLEFDWNGRRRLLLRMELEDPLRNCGLIFQVSLIRCILKAIVCYGD